MLTLKHEVILKMKESFYRGENQEYLLYFPGAKICGHSYFQWFHNTLDMNQGFFETLVILNPEAFKELKGKDFEFVRKQILGCLFTKVSCIARFTFIKELLEKFDIKILVNPKKCFIGNIGLLLDGSESFEKEFRANYRRWLYGLNFKDLDVSQVDNSPVGLKEFFKVTEFLELPFNLN
jgi:hypothetical protein